MDADRAQHNSDPNGIFMNTPEGGGSGYSEMNLMRWVNNKIAALYRR